MRAPAPAALLDLTATFLPGTTGVRDVGMMTGGASREIWTYVADTPAGEHALVLRRDPGAGGPDPGWEDLQLDRTREFAVLAAAHRHGVTVARPWTAFSDPDLGCGLVTDRVPGTADPRSVLAGPAPEALLARLGAELAAIHSAPIHSAPIHSAPIHSAPIHSAPIHSAAIHSAATDLLPPAAAEPPEAPWRRRIDALELRSPVVELAMVWLARNRPPARAPVLVHGDFRTGNLMVDDGRLVAVLDWEGAHLGEPGEDLGWLCTPAWQFGRPARPAGGLGTGAELLDAYRAAGGAPIGPDELRWWQVLGSLRWCVMCHMMAHLHRSGVRPSLELAAIGRRACENEYDLLDLMEES